MFASSAQHSSVAAAIWDGIAIFGDATAATSWAAGLMTTAADPAIGSNATDREITMANIGRMKYIALLSTCSPISDARASPLSPESNTLIDCTDCPIDH